MSSLHQKKCEGLRTYLYRALVCRTCPQTVFVYDKGRSLRNHLGELLVMFLCEQAISR